MIEHSAQHLDELTVAIWIRLQLRAHLRQGGRQVPILKRGAVAQGARLPDENWQIVPGIVDDLVAPEVAWMIGHHFVVEDHDDAFRIGPHQHHPAGGPRVDAVAVMIGHDQAGGAGSHRLLDKTVEGLAQLHQARSFFLEYVPDRAVLELWVFGSFGVGDALIDLPLILWTPDQAAWRSACSGVIY